MVEIISIRDVKDMLGMWENVLEFVYKNRPEKVATDHASVLLNETCQTHYRIMLRARKRHTSLDSF